jgi:hypothetical protein
MFASCPPLAMSCRSSAISEQDKSPPPPLWGRSDFPDLQISKSDLEIRERGAPPGGWHRRTTKPAAPASPPSASPSRARPASERFATSRPAGHPSPRFSKLASARQEKRPSPTRGEGDSFGSAILNKVAIIASPKTRRARRWSPRWLRPSRWSCAARREGGRPPCGEGRCRAGAGTHRHRPRDGRVRRKSG